MSRLLNDHLESRVKAQEQKRLDSVKVFSDSISEHSIEERIEMVSAEVVLGGNIFSDIAIEARDFVGGKSKSLSKLLEKAKRECTNQLKENTIKVGGNCVSGVRINFSNPSNSKNIVMISMYGTAVKLKTS